jgi:hypothetical protein
VDRDHGEDITIVGRTTASEVGDRVEVEWRLSGTPALEWAEIFQMADVAEREGDPEWVLGGGPDVLHDVVRWFVPSERIEEADIEVRHRLAAANARFGAESSAVGDDQGTAPRPTGP